MRVLPETLREAIEEEISSIESKLLAESSQALSLGYRNSMPPLFQRGKGIGAAYLATRLPATYAAIKRVLQEIKQRAPDLRAETLLDLGAGPGTALWAVSEVFPSLSKALLVEKEEEMLAMGQRLVKKTENAVLRNAEWRKADLRSVLELPPADLVILSYSLGEISEEQQESLLPLLWKATRKVIVIIEPGTPRGFSRIRSARKSLISLGGIAMAPCGHQGQCPLADGDWCHFSERLERSFEHRRAKGAVLPYEDEKFSYIAISKEEFASNGKRILRPPQKRSGHVSLTLCTQEGVEERVVSRKEKENYRKARKAEWGEVF